MTDNAVEILHNGSRIYAVFTNLLVRRLWYLWMNQNCGPYCNITLIFNAIAAGIIIIIIIIII